MVIHSNYNVANILPLHYLSTTQLFNLHTCKTTNSAHIFPLHMQIKITTYLKESENITSLKTQTVIN